MIKNSNCGNCLVEDESFRLGGMDSNFVSLDFVYNDHTYQPFHLENVDCGTCLVQDSTLEDLISSSSSISGKQAEFQKMWSIFFRKIDLCCTSHS